MKIEKHLSGAFNTVLIATVASLFLAGCGGSETESAHDGEAHAEGLPCVIVSTTDLMGIVEAIAGDLVELHCFGKGNQDPHSLDILPSYVREMNDADLWIQVGNDIETAWYPDLMANVKSTQITQGSEGFVDISELVMPLEGAVGTVTGVGHSSGLHPAGNPHYLLDPIEGIRAAKLIVERLNSLMPEHQEGLQQNYEAFRKQLAEALIGAELAVRHDVIEIADLYLNDELTDFLGKQRHGIALGGWLARIFHRKECTTAGKRANLLV